MEDNYIVSARKYRPATFDTVVGQQALTTTLKNAIATGKLAHAYLFCGPRGVGKTTCARIFAKTINCLSPLPGGEACDECESCKAFNEQRSFNIHELDAASNNSVDDIRTLIDQVRIPPQVGKYKVYIIDEVHMLSQNAFNAFLKTLEEPPHHTIFILATTEKHKILPTILSRCQIYDFNRITIQDTVDHLAKVAQNEGIHAESEALNVIAQKADGGMRDALSIFDQVASFTGGNITYQSTIDNLNVLDYEYYFRLTDFLLAEKVEDSLLLLDEILKKGFDAHHFITGLHAHLRDLLVSRDAATLALLEVGASIREKYRQQAAQCSPKFLYRAMKLCNDCDLNYRQSKNKRFFVELTLIQIAQSGDDDEASGLSPKQTLKPIFQRTPQSEVNVQPATTQPATTAQPAAPVQSVTVQPTSVAPAATVSGTSPVASTFPEQKTAAQPTIKKIKAGQLGFSIRQRPAAKNVEIAGPATTPATDVRPAIQEDRPIRIDELQLKWREFAMSLPSVESAYKARLMNIEPRLLSDGCTVEGAVENEMVQKDLLRLAPQLTHFLREALHNSKVQILISVNEEAVKVRAYSKLERYQMMSEKNENLKKLKELFLLELS